MILLDEPDPARDLRNPRPQRKIPRRARAIDSPAQDDYVESFRSKPGDCFLACGWRYRRERQGDLVSLPSRWILDADVGRSPSQTGSRFSLLLSKYFSRVGSRSPAFISVGSHGIPSTPSVSVSHAGNRSPRALANPRAASTSDARHHSRVHRVVLAPAGAHQPYSSRVGHDHLKTEVRLPAAQPYRLAILHRRIVARQA